jgi:hypothetical protein
MDKNTLDLFEKVRELVSTMRMTDEVISRRVDLVVERIERLEKKVASLEEIVAPELRVP